MENICAVILAGGDGTRMKSAMPKVMAKLLFKPMIDWVIEAAKGAGIEDICVVTGRGCDVLEPYLEGRTETVRQECRLGTGHAVMQADGFIEKHKNGKVLILNGDAPLIDSESIKNALAYHTENGFAQTVISAEIPCSTGYGRIVRDKNRSFTAIVEEADADDKTKAIKEINSGAIWFDCEKLLCLLKDIKNDNAKGEYYLTDTVKAAKARHFTVGAYLTDNANSVLGANNRLQLNALNETVRQMTIDRLMLDGVDIPCRDGVIIDNNAQIGADTLILPGTIIKNGCTIGSGCTIGPNTVLENTTVGKNSVLNSVQAESAAVGDNANLGPFVHLRPNAKIGNGVRCGNFVEVKNSSVGDKTSVSHLTYVGDSDVGSGVNFGCGCVTVNFNGKTKNRCVIGDNAFIGCNTNLIAPVKIGDRAYTAAGSTITEDVPEDALVIARSRQCIKKDWVKIKKPYREKK